MMTFEDKSVPYETFVQNVAAKLASFLKEDKNDAVYISTREAYRLFGRASVERWRKQGKIEPCKRPGKIEYQLSRLRELSRTVQDYLLP